MRRTLMLLVAACGLATLCGCIGYVPVPVGHEARYEGPPPRAHRDRDGDGVPDRADRRPENPYRY